MAKQYLERLDALLAPAARDLPPEAALEIKHFFSGAAAYAQGRICITRTPVGLALKLPEAARDRLARSGAQPLRYTKGADQEGLRGRVARLCGRPEEIQALGAPGHRPRSHPAETEAVASKVAPLMGFGFELSDTVRGERFTTRAQRCKVGSQVEI